MATLLLTAVGSAIAGPIGAAIGAMAGQRVDQALLGGKGRQGARLADLSVQSSSYGARIPRIYGQMRVSGTVIWATDLHEERQKVSQGKGRPKATVYSYSASFAVLLSGRPAVRIGRIWADGKLLRGAAGDFKVETGFRFHSGAPDQPVDPLIASAEGAEAPAYRGRAYAVFEDMALESFGNRIPILSFEVFADEDGVTTADVASDLSAGLIHARLRPTRFQGYIADGANVRAALAPLDSVENIELRDNGSVLELDPGATTPLEISRQASGASPQVDGRPEIELTRESSATLPSRSVISFADTSRDYQNGLQSVDLHLNGTALDIELPAALDAETARQLVVDRLFRARQEGLLAELRLPWRYLAAWNASAVHFDGVTWRVRRLRFEAMCVVLDLSALTLPGKAALPADAGRAVLQPDQLAGETVLCLVDLPPMGDAASTTPLVVVAAAGRGDGWRSAALMMRADGIGEWQGVGNTAAPAIMGICTHALDTGSTRLIDLANTLMVDLLRSDMVLVNVDDAGLFAGANAALVGAEIIQFGRAERLGPVRWRLSRLLRGRRGTEADAITHQANEPFLLLDSDTMVPLDIPPGTQSVEVAANGVADPVDVHARCVVTGNALRPLSPVHLRSERRAGGGIRISWIRRSREGWRWLDLVDVPLGEEAERYRVRIETLSGPVEYAVDVPELVLSAEIVDEAMGQGAAAIAVSIVQIGRFAASRPLGGQISLQI